MILCVLYAGLWLLFWLTACSNNSTPTYSIGGTTNGLSGTLVLQCNGEDDLSMNADGTFTFATPLEDGSDYAVTILSAPPMQNCTISNNTGILAGANITDVGTFTFATPLEDGSDYAVTILSAPPMQNCTISNDTGTLAGHRCRGELYKQIQHRRHRKRPGGYAGFTKQRRR
jgi:hypothetical protein